MTTPKAIITDFVLEEFLPGFYKVISEGNIVGITVEESMFLEELEKHERGFEDIYIQSIFSTETVYSCRMSWEYDIRTGEDAFFPRRGFSTEHWKWKDGISEEEKKFLIRAFDSILHNGPITRSHYTARRMLYEMLSEPPHKYNEDDLREVDIPYEKRDAGHYLSYYWKKENTLTRETEGLFSRAYFHTQCQNCKTKHEYGKFCSECGHQLPPHDIE